MAEVTVSTSWGREIKVIQRGNIFISVEETDVSTGVQSYITADEAKQIGNALLQAAEGKLTEPRYYLHVQPESEGNQYLNLKGGHVLLDSKANGLRYQTQFTQEEIDNNPLLKPFEQFKVLVPANELD